MEYKKKQQTDPTKNRTEGAYERPPTSRGGRGPRGGARGNRGDGNREEKRDDKPAREVTEKRDDDRRGRGGRGGRGGPREDGPRTGGRPAIDENSYQWKYRNEPRPVYETKTVSMDEELPELPTEIKSKPSKDEFDRLMREQDKLADSLRVTIEDNKFKRRQVYDGGKVEGSNVTYSDLIGENIEEVKKFKSNRRDKLDRLNELKARQI